jgi:hypothetical protein
MGSGANEGAIAFAAVSSPVCHGALFDGASATPSAAAASAATASAASAAPTVSAEVAAGFASAVSIVDAVPFCLIGLDEGQWARAVGANGDGSCGPSCTVAVPARPKLPAGLVLAREPAVHEQMLGRFAAAE